MASYEDLSYEEALAVFDREIHIIDPNLIFAAREKAKEALKIMIEKEEETMTQTSGRYPMINKEEAVSSARTIWELRDHIDFLKGFDPRKAVQITPPPWKMSHNQYQLLIGRATKVVYATLGAGTQEEVERAVKFFLVMIDAEKHLLDVDEAKEKYGFKELEDKYVRGFQE